MEELCEKCDAMRKTIKTTKKYQETDIYVILSPPDANAARTPCSALLITALDKLRESAGVLPSIREPNLILAAHMAEMPVTSHRFLHWHEPTFCKNVALNLERITDIFDNKLKNLRPFLRLSDEKFLALYGPLQETMEFEFHGHQKKHESMKKAIESIIADDSPKFGDLQLAVHTAIYSLNCEHCLFYILNPLNTIEKLQKFVKTLTRGVWCPRDRKEMKTTMDWVDEKGKKCMKTCWRLEDGVTVPKVLDTRKREKSSKIVKNPKEHHLKTLQSVMQLLSGNIQKLGDETNFEKMEKSAQMAQKLKTHNIGLGLLYMELQNASFEIGRFGFVTGDTELDEGLERAAAEMLENGDFNINITGIIARMDKESLKKYRQIRDPLRTEKGLIDRIAEKLRNIVEMNSGRNEEKPEATSSESSSESSESDSDGEDASEDTQNISTTSDDSDEPEMSPPAKRAKLTKQAEPRKKEKEITKPLSISPRKSIIRAKTPESSQKPLSISPRKLVIEAKKPESPKKPTSISPKKPSVEPKQAEVWKKPISSSPRKLWVEPKKAEILKNPSPISPEVIDVEYEMPERHENFNVLKNAQIAISPKKKTSAVKEVEIIEIEDDDEPIPRSPSSEVLFEHPDDTEEPEEPEPGKPELEPGEPEPEPEHKKMVSYARRTGKPYVPGDSDDDEDSEEEPEKGAEPEVGGDDDDDEISVIFDSGDVKKGNDSADSSFNFTAME